MIEECNILQQFRSSGKRNEKKSKISSYLAIIAVEKFDNVRVVDWILIKGCENRHASIFNEFC